jgi:hypothetical protein
LQALLLSALPKANRSNGVAQLAIVSLLHTTLLLSVGVSLQEFCGFEASLHKYHEYFWACAFLRPWWSKMHARLCAHCSMLNCTQIVMAYMLRNVPYPHLLINVLVNTNEDF